ncbi:MAG TPA: C-terminal binding protein [Chloroflexota bacterium]|nr:C-terminal binding protein [Chloroflexota bacterium]
MTATAAGPERSTAPAQSAPLPVRWQNRDSWPVPGIVTYGGRGGGQISPENPTHKMMLDEKIDLRMAPFLDESGKATKDVLEADVVISGGMPLSANEFKQLPKTRLLLRPYVGYDDIDVDAADAEGILVANVPDAFSEEVANHALALILGANQQLLISDRYVRSGEWEKQRGRPKRKIEVRRLSALTLGFVGFGNIARLTAERARPFGFTMVAYDPFLKQEVADPYGVTLASLDQVLAQSDIVTIHTFLHATTRHLINAERFAQMKQGAYLVNTARGPIVDEVALIAALKSGHLAGAALDVTEVEPLAASSELIKLENTILTPHMASESVEGRQTLMRRVAEIARSVALGQLPERHVVVNKGLYDRIAAQLWPGGA